MSEYADTPPPQRHVITSRAELFEAFANLLERMPHEVRCASHDGRVFGLHSRAVCDAFEKLLLAQRNARIRVLVDDPGWLEREAPRLKALQRRFPHALELRASSSDDPVGDDAFVIGDARDLLLLQATAHPQGDLYLSNEPRVQPWHAGFDRRWDGGAHNLPVAPLGL